MGLGGNVNTPTIRYVLGYYTLYRLCTFRSKLDINLLFCFWLQYQLLQYIKAEEGTICVCFTIFFYYFNYFQGAQTRYTIVSFGLNQPLVDTPMHTRLWSFGSSTQFCLIFKQCYLLLARHLQFLVFQKCGYMYLMCDTTIICLFSYLVYPGDLVPFLWEINCSYNKLFKKVNKYAYP